MTDGENGREAEQTTVADAATVTEQTVRVKRTPRYARFILVAVVICAAVAFILTYSFPQGPGYDRAAVFGYLLLVAIAAGVVLGSLAALLADRINARRAALVVADRVDVPARSAEDAAAPDAAELSAAAESPAAVEPAEPRVPGEPAEPGVPGEPRAGSDA
jgi:hypothetical protein